MKIRDSVEREDEICFRVGHSQTLCSYTRDFMLRAKSHIPGGTDAGRMTSLPEYCIEGVEKRLRKVGL